MFCSRPSTQVTRQFRSTKNRAKWPTPQPTSRTVLPDNGRFKEARWERRARLMAVASGESNTSMLPPPEGSAAGTPEIGYLESDLNAIKQAELAVTATVACRESTT